MTEEGSSPNNTRASLLLRLKDANDQDAWSEFEGLYSPLLYRYARRRGLCHEDAEDVRSECYTSLVRQMPRFEYRGKPGGFKAWLKTMVGRRVIDRLRRRRERTADSELLHGLVAGEPSINELWEREWKIQHLRCCVQQASAQVSQKARDAFRMLVEDELSVDEVCTKLSMNANQIYKAKSRILALVREKMTYLTAGGE